MSKFLKPSLVALTLSAAAVAGYLGYRAFESTESSIDPGDTLTPTDSSLVDELPDFALDDLAGNSTPISHWAGRPLIVNFWATWCAPCLREIPLLKATQTQHPELQVVGIAVDRVAPVVAFAADMDFNYPILVGPEAMSAAGAFGVDLVAMPFTVFTASSGSVLGVHTGELHAEHLDRFVELIADLEAGSIDIAGARAALAGRL